jgi:hypothetical protein
MAGYIHWIFVPSLLNISPSFITFWPANRGHAGKLHIIGTSSAQRHRGRRDIELEDSSSVSGKAMASVGCLRSSSTGGSACRRG